MKPKIKYGFIIIAILLLLISGYGWYSTHQALITAEGKNTVWAAANAELTERHRNDSIKDYTMQQKVGSERDAKIVAQDEAKYWKSIKSVVKADIGVSKKDIVIQYVYRDTHDTIDRPDTTQCDGIPIGTGFAYSDKWFYTTGSLGEDNIHIDSVGFYPGSVRVIIGNQKAGFLKRSRPAVSLVFENPHMVVSSANNIVVSGNKKPRRGLWLLGGIAIGMVGGMLAR